MEPTEGTAFIIAVQQRESLDEKALRSLLAEVAKMPVETVQDNEPVRASVIYLAPPDTIFTLQDGRFKTRPAEQPAGERGIIDSFLVSLAKNKQEHAIAVLMAGTGSDGTLGATAIKEESGLTIAEETPETTPAAMESSSAAAAIADFVLQPGTMPGPIIRYVRHLGRLKAAENEEEFLREASPYLARIAAILRNNTGHDFHGYKQNTFLRRVHRRMQVVQCETLESYVELLRREPEESQNLFNDLLIGVTQFFRDRKEFELLEAEVIPKLFEDKGSADQVRIWVLGCATGEEAYSIAILLREHMAKLDATPHVQIFATDIDGRALAAARAGRYSEAAVREFSPERLTRWFVREGNTYCVVKELREMCLFSSHNLIKDAPFSRLDMISCRNLLIYLNSDIQNRVIPLFHFALRPNGFLFLGNSENVTRHNKLFTPIDRRYRIFRRLETHARILPEFPLTASANRHHADLPPITRSRIVEQNLAKRASRIAESHAPPYVVVDENHDVLHFSGRNGRFLEPSTGAASLNLLNLIHRDLRLDLRAALHRAATEKQIVKVDNLKLRLNGDTMVLGLIVEPVKGDDGEPASFVVIFRDGEILHPPDTDDHAFASQMRDDHVQQLEAELKLTRERLQATIEELESTNEELKSSNEEYQSINEELQSANEELETSKEELQSVNEELQTVNGELGHRVSELAHANSDLKNLLESTQIATVFLDNDLRVKSFTPAVTEIFHLIDTDLNRPITHIASRIAYEELQDDMRKVLRTLGRVEREVGNPRTGSRYLVRVLPYRSIDNFIAGVVLTFLDITATVRAEQALRISEERLRMMARIAPVFLFTATPDLNWDFITSPFYDYTGLPEGNALGMGWQAAIHPDDLAENRKSWARWRGDPGRFTQEYRIRGADGGYRWFTLMAEAVSDEKGEPIKWYGTIADSHKRRVAEERQNLLLAELQHRVKNVLAVVRSISRRTAETSATLQGFISHFDGRLAALARTQNILVRHPESGIDLRELISEEVVAHSAREDGQITLSGADVRLDSKSAETLGLALHELATNAVKYGALSNHSGRIKVSWRVYGDGDGNRLRLEWQENGVSVLDTSPKRNGFGRELIEKGLAYQLGAKSEIEFTPGGLRCAIDFPLMGKEPPKTH
jgi:two-component system CheB/CheR fusion protein